MKRRVSVTLNATAVRRGSNAELRLRLRELSCANSNRERRAGSRQLRKTTWGFLPQSPRRLPARPRQQVRA